jgi:predicted lysophospholipase L1 biosynthesis ABC-type transport system permease subunit
VYVFPRIETSKDCIYYPAAQVPRPAMALILKTAVDPRSLVPQVRDAVQSLDPEQPIADVRTMDEWVARSLETRRAPMLLLSLFGLVALILSAIGIYGVLASGIAQRVREFGIRQALGADRASILALVLTQGLRTSAAGVAIGVAASLAATTFLQSLLFGVVTRDFGVYAIATAVLFGVAICACYVPARRATRLDPMAALRES